MSEPRTKADWQVIAGLAVLLVLMSLGTYLGGYLLLGESSPERFYDPVSQNYEVGTVRYYDAEWLLGTRQPDSP